MICNDCAILRELAQEIPGRYIRYGLHNSSDYEAKNLCHKNGGVCGDVYYHGEKLGRLQLHVAGEHNISNALAAIAVGRELGLTFAQCAMGLSQFRGTGRRYELLAAVPGFQVVDDYAHHPTEIAATIQAARVKV